MLESNIEEIISNTKLINKDKLFNKTKEIIKAYREVIDSNKLLLMSANKIDKKNNGFDIDFDVIENIFVNVLNEENIYGTVTLSKMSEELIYGKEILDKGNVIVINDGNTYVVLEMILRNLLVGNTTIITNNGYMYGVNNLLIIFIQEILDKYNINKNLVQLCIDSNLDILDKTYGIDLVVCIGNKSLQNRVLNKCKSNVVLSGYENFDIYVEDDTHKEFIDKIVSIGLNIDIYIDDKLDLEYSNSIKVNGIEGAINAINVNSSKYSVAIFTTNSDNASKFIKEIKANQVTVNTSPTIERIMDINQSDLYIEKKVIYPNNIKIMNTIELDLE